jgi:hypothetical protein
MLRAGRLLAALGCVLVGVTGWLPVLAVGAPAVGAATIVGPDLWAYKGLGTWVDAFDYAPRLRNPASPPTVTADSVRDMARLGVKTLYLQVGRDDDDPTRTLVDEPQLGEFLVAAHRVGVAVVAWYLPTFEDVAADARQLKAILNDAPQGEHFDAVALDLEWTKSVPDTKVRNNRAVALAKQLRTMAGKRMALGAIVLPAVQTEVINPVLWPDFPYARLAPYLDVWLPMSYYTFRSVDSGYRDPYRYAQESVTRLRAHLKGTSAPVHVIGGIADLSTPDDYRALLRVAKATKAVGYSVYDFATTASSAWSYLRGDAQSNLNAE